MSQFEKISASSARAPARRSEGSANTGQGAKVQLRGKGYSEQQELLSPSGPERVADAEEGCKCGGTPTGEVSETQQADTETRYDADLALEAEYDAWINYDPAKEEEEQALVAEHNHRFDTINADERKHIASRYERNEANVDATVESALDNYKFDHPGVSDKAARENLRPGEYQKGDSMWQADNGTPWTGFTGDLNYTGETARPEGASWRSNAADIGEVFGPGFADQWGAEKDEDFGIPIKSYSKFEDEKGKVTTTAQYGFAQRRPTLYNARWEVWHVLTWCPVYESSGRGLKLTDGADGKSVLSTNGRRKMTSGRGGKTTVDQYQQCEQWIRRDKKGHSPDKQRTSKQVDAILRNKRSDYEALKKYYLDRRAYIQLMENGPKKAPTR